MNDNTLNWVIPAITLGYAVVQDRDGRLRFFSEDVEIVHRKGGWIGRDNVDPDREYLDLPHALQGEAWRLPE